jgi:hypothetical protein
MRIAGRMGSLAAMAAAWLAAPTQAAADWLDEMPSVAEVAAVIDREYAQTSNQSTVAINTAAALILLRQLLEYRLAEDAGLSPQRRAEVRAIEDAYLRAELAIGRQPGSRRGALSPAEVRRFYESRRYQACATADCYRYWVLFQLEFWNAANFRQRVLPLLFPCGSAADVLEIAARNAMSAPLVPYTPAASVGGDPTLLERLARNTPAAAACSADGADLDGDGLCHDWEAQLRRVRTLPAAITCDMFALERATTSDAASITLTFRTTSALANRPIRVTACRASAPTPEACRGAASQQLGSTTLSAATDLAPGQHDVTLFRNQPLPLDTRLPYVVVIGEAAGQRSDTYFEKRLMGVVVHGYTFKRLLAVASLDEDLGDAVRDYLLGNEIVDEWQAAMVASLKSAGCYDDSSFAYDWRFDSTLELRSLLTARAAELYDEIVRRATAMRSQHDGDVVDLHLIGHSRGAVILSEALKEWQRRRNDALRGSYVRITMLDPHPGTNDVSPQEDVYAPDDLAGAAINGWIYSKYRETQGRIDDPLPIIVAGVGVREAEVWFQHSRVAAILAAPVVRDPDMNKVGLNLWGLGGATDTITRASDPSLRILWRDLTGMTLADGSVVDHPRVVDYFQAHIDRNAVRGRCVVPPR